MTRGELWRRLEGPLGAAELGTDVRLRMLCGFLCFYGYVTFTQWYGNPALSTEGTATFNYVPTWVFEHLRGLIFLDQSATKLLMAGLSVLALFGCLLALAEEAVGALLVLHVLFFAKLFFYLSDLRLVTNYHHIHLILTFFFLFTRSRLFFTRVGLVLCYHLAAFTKMTPSWLMGEAFNSVPDKLPFLASTEGGVRLACRALIAWELAGPLLWAARSAAVRRASVWVFVAFHLYSVVLVGYRYPAIMLPALLSATLWFDAPLGKGHRFRTADLAGWIGAGLLYAGGLASFLIPGDGRLTSEGRYLGLFMFDANRAVRFRAELVTGDRRLLLRADRPWRSVGVDDFGGFEEQRRGKTVAELYEGGMLLERFKTGQIVRDRGVVVWNPALFTTGGSRCFGDPYLYYFWAKELCRRYRPDRLAVRLESKLDGREETHVVLDLPDFCGASPRYNPFWHNDWINIGHGDPALL
ncbi:MAG: hypothetical protein HY553_20060 [Elusimicrobia bacterium]|nr:hypothetical protein [Elusimicrobiota bacterium]